MKLEIYINEPKVVRFKYAFFNNILTYKIELIKIFNKFEYGTTSDSSIYKTKFFLTYTFVYFSIQNFNDIKSTFSKTFF